MGDNEAIDIANHYRYGDINALKSLEELYTVQMSGDNVKPVPDFDGYYLTRQYELLSSKRKRVIPGLLRRLNPIDDTFTFVYPMWKNGIKYNYTMKEIVKLTRGEDGLRRYEDTLFRSFKGR